MATGVDYSGSRPDPARLYAAGIRFVIRYLTPDTAEHAWKRFSTAETRPILNAGLGLAFVFESGKTRMRDGRAAGQADAGTAQAQLGQIASSAGIPGLATLPVIFTADWDVQPGEVGACLAYLDGAHSRLGVCAWDPARRRTSVYGGYRAVSSALNGGKAGYAMQTYAWSGWTGGPVPAHAVVLTQVAGRNLPGRFLFDSRAQIRQGVLGSVAAADVDWDESVASDYGQWPRPASAAVPDAPATGKLLLLGD